MKKIQIAGGREELLKKRIELYSELSKLREIDSVSPEAIDKVEFELKTPEEQRQKELQEQREININSN